MPDPTACPDPRSLRQLLLGQAPDAQAEALEQHLLSCPRCVETVRMFQDESTLLADIQQGASLAAGMPEEGPEVEKLVERMRNLSASFRPADTAATVAPRAEDPTSGGVGPPEAEDHRDCLLPAQGPGEIGRLGPYRVLKVLGAGGMGVVFEAEDPQLQRRVALKVMHGDMARDPACRERFLREARAAAGIEHDNIVAVYQVGEDHGVPFLAMPLLQGETLEERLGREVVPPIAEVLRVGRETAAGLAAAHARGLVHRDIKPGNLWLEAGGGRVKIVDFGLARLTQENVRLTKAGYILGTPSYMAPEQAQGRGAVDGRSDLYSLGVVLYRMATGRLPFVQDDLIALLTAVATQPPAPLRGLNPEVPPGLEELVLRLLAKTPDERPASAAAVVEAVRALEGGAATRPARRARAGLAITAALVVLLGAAAPAVYRLVTDHGRPALSGEEPDARPVVQREDEKAKRPAKVGEIRSFTGHTRLVSCVAFADKGRRAVSGSYDKTIRLWDVDGGGELRCFRGHTKTVRCVAVSPDGGRLASGGGDQVVRLWDVASGEQLRELPGHTDTITGVAFSGDGKVLASAGLDQTIRLWSAANGKGLREPQGELGPIEGLAFSPDGRYLLGGGRDRRVRLWDTAGDEVQAWGGHEGVVLCVAFSPDGARAASGGAGGEVLLWDVPGGKRVARWRSPEAAPVHSLAFTPDGERILAGCADGALRLWDAASRREARRFTGHKGKVWGVAVSADGRFALSGGEDRTVRLWGLPPPE